VFGMFTTVALIVIPRQDLSSIHQAHLSDTATTSSQTAASLPSSSSSSKTFYRKSLSDLRALYKGDDDSGIQMGIVSEKPASFFDALRYQMDQEDPTNAVRGTRDITTRPIPPNGAYSWVVILPWSLGRYWKLLVQKRTVSTLALYWWKAIGRKILRPDASDDNLMHPLLRKFLEYQLRPSKCDCTSMKIVFRAI
jgi:hypothetical protein